MNMEKFSPLAKFLHCHRQWREGQISPLSPSLNNQVWWGDQEADHWPFRDVREACWVRQVQPFFGWCNLKSMRIAQIAVKFFMISTTTMPKRCFVRILKRKLCSKRWRGGLQSEMAVFGSLLDTEMERGRESRSRVRKNISLYFHFYLSISAPVWGKKSFWFCLIPSS